MTQKPSSSSSSSLSTLHDLQLTQLFHTFQTLDSDNDGLIKCSQLVQLFSEVQVQNFNNLSYRYLVRLTAMKGNEMIDFNGFVRIVQGEIGGFGDGGGEREGIRAMFGLYDAGTGRIGVEEIAKIVERLGEPYNSYKISEWLKQFGNQNDGSKVELNFEDFYNLLTKKYY